MKPSGCLCLLEAADMPDQDWNATETMFRFRASRTVQCSEPCQRKQRHREPKEVTPGPSNVSSQPNLLQLYHTPSHTWLGLLPANPCPDSQEVKLGKILNTIWIPGLWSYWRNFSLWMEAKWRCKSSDGKGWQSLCRFNTGVTYHSLSLTVTWHLKEPLEMKASPWGMHT